jgi:hypothetical protein
MGYIIVQFINWKDGTSLLAVPESWLVVVSEKCMCYFPKRNAAKLIEQQATARGDWQLFEVRKLSSKAIPHYDTARQKELDANFTSAIDSSDEEQVIPLAKKPRNILETGKNAAFSGELKII